MGGSGGGHPPRAHGRLLAWRLARALDPLPARAPPVARVRGRARQAPRQRAPAGGVAEALVTTAFGIAVAIPAVMLFNYFTNRIELVATDISEAASALVDHLRKRVS